LSTIELAAVSLATRTWESGGTSGQIVFAATDEDTMHTFFWKLRRRLPHCIFGEKREDGPDGPIWDMVVYGLDEERRGDIFEWISAELCAGNWYPAVADPGHRKRIYVTLRNDENELEAPAEPT
jgi:hypothetical protein